MDNMTNYFAAEKLISLSQREAEYLSMVVEAQADIAEGRVFHDTVEEHIRRVISNSN